MAVSLGKNFRRLLAQALAADQGEMRALVERLLPRGADGKRVLRLQHEVDRPLLPLAIVAALSADAITGDEAEELKRQAKSAEVRPLWRDDFPPELLCISPLERIRLGYVRPREEDPLAESIRAWGEVADSRCDAANSGPAIVNNNENTMAAVGEIGEGEKPNPL